MNILAGLIQGKIDTKKEILLSNYSKMYDRINENLFLGNISNKSPHKNAEIKKTFSKIKQDCHRQGIPVPASITKLEKIAIENNKGNLSDQQAIRQIRTICTQNGVNTYALDMVESRINMKDGLLFPSMMQKKSFNPIKGKSAPLKNFLGFEEKQTKQQKRQGMDTNYLSKLTERANTRMYKTRRRNIKKGAHKDSILGKFLRGGK